MGCQRVVDEPMVSIIIVSHDSGPLLIECVHSALASAAAIEVLVSDNDSHDGSIEAVEALARLDSRLRVLRNGSNLGFASANNRALALARGDYVLFLNPDCLVRPDTMVRMVAVLEAHPEAAAKVEQCSINLGAATLTDEDFSAVIGSC